jgi:hypothetical protein
MRYMVMITLLLLLSAKNTHGTEWNCTGASNTGTFQLSTDCTISGTATTNGGGVVVSNTLKIAGTVEDMNNLIVINAPSNARHFYVSGVNDELTLQYLKLTGGSSNHGGSISIYTSGKINVYFSVFSQNAANYGGAIFATGSYKNRNNLVVFIYNSTFASNTVSGNTEYGGGCVSLEYSTGSIAKTVFSDCSCANVGRYAHGGGGGMYILSSDVVIDNAGFFNNKGGMAGGALYVKSNANEPSNVNITRTTIMNNKITSTNSFDSATGGGGLNVNGDYNKINVRETSFIGNIAINDHGNAICTTGAPTVSIVNTFFFQPNDPNLVSGSPTSCSSKPCTEKPYTGACTAVDKKKLTLGVYCQCTTCDKCPAGTTRITSGTKNSCKPCPSNYYTSDGITCKQCTGGKTSPPGSPKCYDIDKMLQNVRSLNEQQGDIIKSIALSDAKSNEVKQKANGLIAKLSLDWATQDIINEAQERRNQLSQLPEYNVQQHCAQEKQRLAYGVLRTGIIVQSDSEIDGKYCLNQNRNRLISSFCNFRPRFIKLLKEKLYPRLPSYPTYTGRDLWPNICCKKDNFENLKTCNDPSGNVPRSHIVPFALAQGGNLTVANLYGEIVDILKKDGYLQQGMSKAVDGIKNGDKLKDKLNNMFETTLLCGPREFGLPTNEAIRLCELFYPYEHMLGTYYDEVNLLLEPLQRRRRRQMLGVWSGISSSFTALMSSVSAFVFGDADESGNNDQLNVIRKLEEKMDMLEKKDAISQSSIKTLKQQANKTNTFLAILKQNKRRKRRLGSASDALCPLVTMSDVSEYEKDIDTFCTGYAHIDLSHAGTIVNLAIMTPWDIPPKLIPELREKARYEISDDCPTPMFTANDISLQNIEAKDLFVIQLDTISPNGYLKKELPQCGAANNIALKPHIPKTTIDVKIWRDHEGCCKDTKDYNTCKEMKCLLSDDPNGVEPVNDPWTNLQVGYHYKVIGTTYTATCDNKPNSKPCGSNSRRRNLLQDEYGNSGERL